MSTSGLAQVGIGAPAPAAIGDATTNPSTVDVAALQMAYNGATWDRLRTLRQFSAGGAAALGNTTIWTPAAGKKFRVMAFMFTLVASTTIAAAGMVTIKWTDGGADTGLAVQSWVPAAPLNNGGLLYTSGWIDIRNGYLSTAANNVLAVNLSTALTAGSALAIAAGIEE